jgi:hypothetical protein
MSSERLAGVTEPDYRDGAGKREGRVLPYIILSTAIDNERKEIGVTIYSRYHYLLRNIRTGLFNYDETKNSVA